MQASHEEALTPTEIWQLPQHLKLGSRAGTQAAVHPKCMPTIQCKISIHIHFLRYSYGRERHLHALSWAADLKHTHTQKKKLHTK